MADVTRRAALAAPVAALAAAAGIAGSAGALAASTTSPSLVTGTDADALRALHLQALAVTPNVAAVVARLHDGELWAHQDDAVAIERAAGGVVVVALPVKHSAVSRIDISTPSAPDTSVSVDTRPDALRSSLLRVVNKRLALARSDEPKKLLAAHGVMVDKRLSKPLDAMFARAEREHVALEAVSAHRDFDDQARVYDAYAERDGKQAADTYSARPGHSEHQLGLALDVRGLDRQHELEPAFKDTPVGRWVGAHAHEFGFVVRYPEGQRAVTGYEPEPWHLRYVGPEVAAFMHARRDIATLENLFGLPAAPGY